MSTPILATKLYIPPPRPNAVRRPRLIERLNEGLIQYPGFGRKLTLISAPAGFGKTTLVSEWIHQQTGEQRPSGVAEKNTSLTPSHPRALAHEAQGDVPSALASLERALMLAEPEGYVRTFVDAGPPMAAMLREAVKHSTAPNYVRQLQAAFGKTAALENAEDRAPVTQNLIEPLSERELDVLRLLGTELSGPEIARELTVSLNTMRTHTKNIYNKLGVNNRRAAVRRAEELDLL